MADSVYIHIPFCNQICSYCDFCKLYYHKTLVHDYLIALEKEILLNPPNKDLKTLYIGGGTPSVLKEDELQILGEILTHFSFFSNYEFTFECNIESITESKLKLLKEMGVTRISYGVETFHSNHLTYLNRHHTKQEVFEKIELTKKYFSNINVDLMYALKQETLEELTEDVKNLLKLDVPHISTYSLMIEPHTVLYNKKEEPILEELDSKMYQTICSTLEACGYQHYEVSNFALPGFESRHNLVYWNNEHYYGYGLGASGYLNQKRYTNTRSIQSYLKGEYKREEVSLTKKEQMQEEVFLGLRKLKGIDTNAFFYKYGVSIYDVFEIQNLIEKGKLEREKEWIRIPKEQIYLSNEVLVYFVGEV